MQDKLGFMIGETNTVMLGVTLAVGVAAALTLGALRAAKNGVRGGVVVAFSALALLLGSFFAHLFYCVVPWDFMLMERPLITTLSFWQGGYMLYGGVFGCLLAAWLTSRFTGHKLGQLVDAYAPAGALMIVFARVAEGYSGQGYGEYLMEGSNFARFPFAIYDGYYEMWAWALFVMEALYALVLVFVVFRRYQGHKPGDNALLLIGLYAAAQVVFESLRRDDFLRWGFVRCSQLLSVIALFIVLLCYQLRAGAGQALKKSLIWAAYAAMIVLCLLLEFATEERIPFLRFLTVENCYQVMAGACVVMAGCVIGMRHLEYTLKA